MPWLVDGNNMAGGGDRAKVRFAALAVARGERVRIVVVFDGAPPAGVPAVEALGQVEIVYAQNADDAIVERVRRGGAGWRVASDDRGLVARVKALGAETVASSGFWSKARGASRAVSPGAAPRIDLDAELAFFREQWARLPEAPARVVRKSVRRRG